MGTAFGTRSLIGLMNFLMWFGNTTIMLMAAIMGISPDIFEAAELDGCGSMRRFFSITLPLIRPILTTVVVFQTMGTWNDFMNANVFLSSSELRTIVLQVYNAVGQFSTDWPSFMTITVLALLPVFVFFIFCQKWIVSGLVAGSVKG
jgi:raffinose/stachyose/melibiose transport system permease protein